MKAKEHNSKAWLIKSLVLFVLFLFSLVQSQSFRLLINGQGLSAIVVEDGKIYASAKEFAQIINGRYALDFDTGLFSLDFNGHILLGNAQTQTANIDKRKQNIPMILRESLVYLEAEGLAKAFGASYDLIDDIAYIIFPRAKLINYSLENYVDYDRVVLEFRGLTKVEELPKSENNILNIFFNNVLAHEEKILYGNRTVLELGSSKGYLSLKLILAEQDQHTSFFEPSSDGFKMIIDIFRGEQSAIVKTKQLCFISELDIAEEIKRIFQENNIATSFFNPTQVSELALNNDLCIELASTELPRSQVNIYFQESKEASFMIQENAAKAIGLNNDPKRQRVLEKLASNFTLGQALAMRVADNIYQTMGYRASIIAEDIELLKNYAGKAIYIEISKEDETNSLLIQTISQSIIDFVKQDD